MKIVDINGAELHETTKAVMCTTGDPDDETAEKLEASLWNPLGYAAMPYPADDNGSAQAMVSEAGVNDQAFAYRDTRTASVYGQLAPGDVAMHSCGPGAPARLFLKEEARVVALMTKDENGKDMLLVMDGVAEKVTISAFKQVIQMSREGGIVLGVQGDSANCSIQLTPDGKITLAGTEINADGLCNLGPAAGITPGISNAAYGVAGPVNAIAPSVQLSVL